MSNAAQSTTVVNFVYTTLQCRYLHHQTKPIVFVGLKTTESAVLVKLALASCNGWKMLPTHVKEVSLFSDTCGSLNRNHFIVSLFLHVTQTFHFNAIEHKFLEISHIKMEVDSMHSAIEHEQQNVSIMRLVYCFWYGKVWQENKQKEESSLRWIFDKRA